MDKEQERLFDKLVRDRRENARILKKRSMRGLSDSAAEKYGDAAHFIYELLQNASDVHATRACFVLNCNSLSFSHNGSEAFTITDVDIDERETNSKRIGHLNSLTSYADSNKDSAQKIGKFGIGFKSIFQYTTEPEIYDDTFWFRLENQIVPTRLKRDHPHRSRGDTFFLLPFNHPVRTSERAYKDISAKLCGLRYPLLFLPHLEEIQYSINGKIGWYSKHIQEFGKLQSGRAEIITLKQTSCDSKKTVEDRLILFTRLFSEGLTYCVGFWLDNKDKLVPRDENAFCFFPTREATGLKFIVHAPFLLTDSRETIKAGEPHNQEMIECLAELAADALEFLSHKSLPQNKQLINSDIIKLIPYDPNLLGEIDDKEKLSFRPFYFSILKAFQTRSILPCAQGYTSKENAYWGDNKVDPRAPRGTALGKVFPDENLAILMCNKNARWVFRDQGRHDLIDGGNKALISWLDEVTTDSLTDRELIENIDKDFIEAKQDEWLHLFYKWLSESRERMTIAEDCPMLKDQEGKACELYDSHGHPSIFLPTELGSDFRTIKPSLIANSGTLAFLKSIGLTEPSLEDEIYQKVLPKYAPDSEVSLPVDDHFSDFKKIFFFARSASAYDYSDLLDELKVKFPLLSTRESNHSRNLLPASKLYLLLPNLEKWFAISQETNFLNFTEYLDTVGKEHEEELKHFLNKLGVSSQPRIYEKNISSWEAYKIADQLEIKWCYSTPRRPESWIDRYIDGLEDNMDSLKECIESSNDQKATEISVLIWNILVGMFASGSFPDIRWNAYFLSGEHKYFYRGYGSEDFEAKSSRLLTFSAWLRDQSGDWHAPSEMPLEKLSDIYDRKTEAAQRFCEFLHFQEIEEPTDIEDEKDENDITVIGKKYGLTNEEIIGALQKAAADKARSENKKKASDASDGTMKKNRVRSKPDRNKEGEESYKGTDSFNVDAEINELERRRYEDDEELGKLKDLQNRATNSTRYSYGWLMAILDLEILNSSEISINSRKISLTFASVILEPESERTLLLGRPNHFLPEFLTELADIPLKLENDEGNIQTLVIEAMSVKANIVRAKIRVGINMREIDFSKIRSASFSAKSPSFLLKALRDRYRELGDRLQLDDEFNLRNNLPGNIEFIFGPPGTGKTTWLARAVIFPLMLAPNRILVLAPTNKAADVLTNRILQNTITLPAWLIRFGATLDEKLELKGICPDRTMDIDGAEKVVVITTIARFAYDYFLGVDGKRRHLHSLHWDYIIVDEASMVHLVQIIYPLYQKTPKKFVIAGDPFQISPIAQVEDWQEENIYSLVGLNSFANPKTIPHAYVVKKLEKQYRSIPQLGNIVSEMFYDGCLKHMRKAAKVLQASGAISSHPVTIIKFPVMPYEGIYKPKTLNNSPYHLYSAIFVCEYIRFIADKLSRQGGNISIGIISPYRIQAAIVERLLERQKMPALVSVQAGTIHSFQGDECDIVVALFNPPTVISASSRVFLNRRNIINVAISRARDKLVILMPDENTSNIDNLYLIKSLEKMCAPICGICKAHIIEAMMLGKADYIEENTFLTNHQSVNVYEKPERRYEVRFEHNAIDIQITG